jgi:methionyl aminopeptidase
MLQREVDTKTYKTLLDLNNLAEDLILRSGGLPTFKGYKGFPNGVCISVNNELVHGIPKNYKLKDGDLVSFDLGVTVEGSITDTAITCVYGDCNSDYKKLISTVNLSLVNSIKKIKIDNPIGVIGCEIEKVITSEGFNVIDKYGGHSISITKNGEGIPHAPPFISNKSKVDDGIRIQPGLVLAIEPMAIIGDNETYIGEDNWTVVGKNISAHFEHTIYISDDFIEVLTWRPNCGIDKIIHIG